MKRSNKGFTLIELLVAVAIIGVLVTLALPRYNAQVARSRQSEAKINLGTIRSLQEAYYIHQVGLGVAASAAYFAGDLGGVTSAKCTADGKNALGFRMSDCDKSYYQYTATAVATGGATATSVKATRKVYPGCNEDDAWSIVQDTGQLSNTTDVVAACKD